jgi:hypothetical protein
MAEARSQIPEGFRTRRARLSRRVLFQPDAQGNVRFAHRTLSLHVTLPEEPIRDKKKHTHDCEEAVEFVGFLWK